MKKFTRIALLIMLVLPVAGFIIASCAEESDCSLTSRATLRGTFYTINENNSRVEIELATLTITALGTDSVILNKDTKVKNVFLPLQYTVDTTALVLHFSDEWKDTIVIKHTNTPYFVSMECGYEMNQSITDCYYTKHVLDSIDVKNNNANKDGKENLQLFLPLVSE